MSQQVLETEQHVDCPTAARTLGVTPSRIRQLCRSGELAAVKWGRDWMITWESIEGRRGYKANSVERRGRPSVGSSGGGAASGGGGGEYDVTNLNSGR